MIELNSKAKEKQTIELFNNFFYTEYPGLKINTRISSINSTCTCTHVFSYIIAYS